MYSRRPSEDSPNDAAEAMIWGRRRLGELLAGIPRERGKRTDRTSATRVTQVQESIADLGVKKSAVKNWQFESRIPERLLVGKLAEIREAGDQPEGPWRRKQPMHVDKANCDRSLTEHGRGVVFGLWPAAGIPPGLLTGPANRVR